MNCFCRRFGSYSSSFKKCSLLSSRGVINKTKVSSRSLMFLVRTTIVNQHATRYRTESLHFFICNCGFINIISSLWQPPNSLNEEAEAIKLCSLLHSQNGNSCRVEFSRALCCRVATADPSNMDVTIWLPYLYFLLRNLDLSLIHI